MSTPSEATAAAPSPTTVALLTRKYPPSVGGMQRWSAELGRALAATAGPRRALQVWAPPAAVAAGPLPLLGGALALRVLAARPARRRGLALIHLGDAALAPAAPLLRAWFGCRVSATVHGLDVTYPAPWYQRLVVPALRGLDATVAVSQSTASACAARGIATTAVVPNGVATQAWAALPQRRAARPALGLADGLWLLSAGRLVRRKGLAWFVADVLPDLVRRVPQARLLIVGDGPEREWIAATARVAGVADRVRLTGRVDEHVLRQAYAAADLFVMPNVAIAGDPEGFGLVALEAAAAGLPVVAAAVDGIPDAVAANVTGRLLPPADAAAWTTALEALLHAPEQRSDLARRARAYASMRDWTHVAAAYWRIFDDLLTHPGQSSSASRPPSVRRPPSSVIGHRSSVSHD